MRTAGAGILTGDMGTGRSALDGRPARRSVVDTPDARGRSTAANLARLAGIPGGLSGARALPADRCEQARPAAVGDTGEECAGGLGRGSRTLPVLVARDGAWSPAVTPPGVYPTGRSGARRFRPAGGGVPMADEGRFIVETRPPMAGGMLEYPARIRGDSGAVSLALSLRGENTAGLGEDP